MSASNPRIHGTGEPWATLAWCAVGLASGVLTLWAVRGLCTWALGCGE